VESFGFVLQSMRPWSHSILKNGAMLPSAAMSPYCAPILPCAGLRAGSGLARPWLTVRTRRTLRPRGTRTVRTMRPLRSLRAAQPANNITLARPAPAPRERFSPNLDLPCLLRHGRLTQPLAQALPWAQGARAADPRPAAKARAVRARGGCLAGRRPTAACPPPGPSPTAGSPGAPNAGRDPRACRGQGVALVREVRARRTQDATHGSLRRHGGAARLAPGPHAFVPPTGEKDCQPDVLAGRARPGAAAALNT